MGTGNHSTSSEISFLTNLSKTFDFWLFIMTAPREFGLELCLKAHAEDIKTQSDVILCLLHWRLLRNSFLSIGDIFYVHSIPSELIPLNLGWNGDTGGYCVKYVYKQKLYVLLLTAPDEGIKFMEAKLHSDTAIVTYKLRFDDCVDDNLVINMTACHALAKNIDTCLIGRLLDMIEAQASAADNGPPGC